MPSRRYEVTRESSRQCEIVCVKLNLKYVAFLNVYISQAKEAFLYELAPHCNIQLNSINSNISKCVPKKRNIFECQCIPNYQIMVSKLLKLLFEAIINAAVDREFSSRTEEFTAFVIFLKYHPSSAGLYFSHLTNKYALVLSKISMEISDSTVQDSNTENRFEGGLIENKGSFLEYDDIIFKAFLEQIDCNMCNIRKFGVGNFDNFNPLTLFIILLILYKKWQVSNEDNDDLLSL